MSLNIISVDSPHVRHDNHTAPGSFTVRNFAEPADFLLIRNTGTDSALISFDGTNGFTIKPDEIMSFNLRNQRSYFTKASAGTPTLEVLVGSDT